MRTLAAALLLVLLYVLHFDVWLWHRPEIVFGLPIGLWYQLVYCVLVASVLAALLSRTASRSRHHRPEETPAP